MANGNKPIKVFRQRGISASVFENHTQDRGESVRFFKVNLQRTFKQNDEFKHNASFGRDDIPVAKLMLDRAWQFILEAEAASAPRNDPFDGT